MFYKLIKQASILLGGNLSASILNFFSVAIAIKALGIELFGVATLLQAYILVFSLCFNPQAWQGLIKYFNIEKNKKVIIKLTLRYDLICALVGTIVAVLFTDIYTKFFNLSEYSELIKWCTLYVFINQTSVAIGVLRYTERYRTLAMQSVISALLFFILAWLGQWYEFGVEYFVGTYLVSLSIGIIYIQLCSCNYVFRYFTNKTNKNQTISRDNKKSYNRFNYGVHLTALADIPVKQLDTILVGAVVSVGAAGAYRVIKQIATVTTKVTGPLNQVLYPEINNLLANKAFEKIKIAMLKLILLLAFPSFFLVLFASLTINYWVPLVFTYELLMYKWQIITFLIIHAAATAFTPIHPVFLALGYVKKLFYITLVSNIILCISIIFLGPKVELWGVLIAIFLQYLLTVLWKLPLILKKLTQEVNESITLRT